MSRMLILLLPHNQGFEIHTSLPDLEVGVRLVLSFTPVESEWLQIGVAHKVLSQHIYAVIQMPCVDSWWGESDFAAPVVVVVDDKTTAESV